MKDDIKNEIVFHPVNFIFFFQKTKSIGTRPVSVHGNSEVIITNDDFTFMFFLTINGKKKLK